MSRKVVVTDYTFPDLQQEEKAAVSGGAEFKSCQCRTDKEIANEAKDADVVVVQFAHFGESAAEAVRTGATVLRYGVGYDNIDIEAAEKFGLKVGYVPDYCTDEVADHTAALILTMLRKLPQLDNSVRQGKWSAVESSRPLKSFSDTTVGFFGMGQIGCAVRKRLEAFGFQFIATDPGLDNENAKSLGVELADSMEMIQRSDLITLHAPATADTVGFFNLERLKRMKPDSMIVNTSRGNLIVENDLATALEDGVIAGAALDVFEEEPLSGDSRLRGLPSCLLTPHAAWYSDKAVSRLQGLIAEDITRALSGRLPRKPVPKP